SQASRVLWPCSRLGPRSRVQQTFPVRGCSVGVCKEAFAHAIDTEPYRRARGTHRRGSGPHQKEQFRQDLECGVSSDTFFLRSGEVRIELAEQGTAVLFGPVAQVLDEILDLLACSLTQTLHPTEVGGIGLHQSRIQLVLANDLAEAIADLGTAVTSVCRLWRQFF